MSLTTVAATVVPDEMLLNLPPSHPEHFQRSDFLAAGLVFAITLGVYIATMSPTVTLEDSGELITGAVKFGVPHPPGYPLWALSGFLLSHLFPFGNLSWRINLESALFGSAANAVLVLLVCHSGRWLAQRWASPAAQPAARQFCFYAGLFAGLTIGFSDIMWSQGVIAEVYTLNALFVNLVLLLFYLWMLEPQKTHRFLVAVFVFALGLTNHHTLVQVIPAFLVAALVLRAGKFWTVFLAVNLFSLSILVYISWLSRDNELQTISQSMAWLIFGLTAVVSFFFLKAFRLHLFLLGVATAVAIFAYGYYLLGPSETDTLRHSFSEGFWQGGTFVHPGWLQNVVANAHPLPPGQELPPRQLDPHYGLMMLGLAALALGLLYTSILNRRLVIGVFIVGWLGLMPYSYERLASSTNPPMNWGYASEQDGFFYAVTRQQYPKSLPTLIKMTFGKVVGVVAKDAHLDSTIDLPDYFPRLGMTFYLYGYDLQDNFTVPLIFLTLAILVYFRRCDQPQVNWFIFLGVAFFLLGFMLQLIAPQETFNFQSNLQYKVFHLQSHCIFVLFMGYGALAAMIYLHETMEEAAVRAGSIAFGMPALYLALLPLWSNFDDCNMAGHWYGYDFGADSMRDMDKNAIFYGGSDAGRFVPTYMAFVESQQPDRWKREPGFDRRDIAVITQNALCDTWYTKYIRSQYDDRFRTPPDKYTPFEKWLGRDTAYPIPSITCMSDDELRACWDEYRAWPDVVERVRQYGPDAVLRPGSNDVFEINGIVAQKIFEKNKKDHTFYLEQSIPIAWMYPYLLPSGLILKLNPTPLESIPQKDIDEDRKYWDAYSQRLLQDPKFRLDDDAPGVFGKLALWHSDMYRYRHLDKEEEYWLKIALALCPYMPEAVNNLTRLLAREQRFDEAIAVTDAAEQADPFNDQFRDIRNTLKAARMFGKNEQDIRNALAKSPYDVTLNLDLARALSDEGKYQELNDQMRITAGLTNWSQEAAGDVVSYYVETAHNPDAALAFMEARAQIDPKASILVYNLAALHASLSHPDQAIKYLSQAIQYGGSNALLSARVDPRFGNLQEDPRFQVLLSNAAPIAGTNATATNSPSGTAPKKAKK